MEKIANEPGESLGFNFTIKPEVPVTIKKIDRIDDAFAIFDQADEETKVSFVLKETSRDAKLEPESRDFMMKNALLLIDGGEFQLARRVLGNILSLQNDDLEAIRWMGWCFKQEKDYQNAKTCYEQLVSRRKTEEDFFEIGEIYYSLEQFDKARDAWFESLGRCHSESPRIFDLHKDLGNAFLRLGDFESAEENYNKALVIRPMSDVLQVNLGTLYFQKTDLKNAMIHFKRAVEINPQNDRAWCGISLVAKQKNDHEWARALLLRSLDINPYNLTSLEALLVWSESSSEQEEVIQRLETYLERYFQNSVLMAELIKLEVATGQIEKAELNLARLETLIEDEVSISSLRNLIDSTKVKSS